MRTKPGLASVRDRSQVQVPSRKSADLARREGSKFAEPPDASRLFCARMSGEGQGAGESSMGFYAGETQALVQEGDGNRDGDGDGHQQLEMIKDPDSAGEDRMLCKMFTHHWK